MSRIVPLLLLLGCADTAFSDGVLDGAAGGGSGSTTRWEHSGASTAPAAPAWYRFDATLALAGGVPAADRSTVTATLHDEAGAEVCSHAVPIGSVEELPRPSADRDLLSWWRLELGAGTPDGPCEPFRPRTVWWGVAAYDPALDPARVAAGLSEATANAAVMREAEGGPTWLVGLFGTDDQLAGYAPAATARPLPDGEHQWRGLILLSW